MTAVSTRRPVVSGPSMTQTAFFDSAAAGLAPTFEVLVVGRALQGACAAVIAPTALSSIAVMFTDGRERGRAFATYGAVASSGAIVGLVVASYRSVGGVT